MAPMPTAVLAARPKRHGGGASPEPGRCAPAARSSAAPFAPATREGRDTMVISRAPIRVSFLGGGSDFPAHFQQHGGAVLTTAINRYAYVTVQPFLQEYFDHKIRLAYRRSEAVNSPAEIQHPAIRATLKKLGLSSGLEMHVMADQDKKYCYTCQDY